MRTTTARFLALPLAALLLVGCSSESATDGEKANAGATRGGGLSAVEKEYARAISVGLLSEEEDTPFDQASADCFGESFAGALGEDALEKAGTVAEVQEAASDFELGGTGITQEQAFAAYDACGDDIASSFKSSVITSDAPEEARKCLDVAITEEGVRDLVAGSVVAGGDTYLEEFPDSKGAQLMEGVMKCAFGTTDLGE